MVPKTKYMTTNWPQVWHSMALYRLLIFYKAFADQRMLYDIQKLQYFVEEHIERLT